MFNEPENEVSDKLVKFQENQRALLHAMESLTACIAKGLVVKYTPGTGTVYRIKKFFQENKIDVVQSIQPSWHSDLPYRLFHMLKNNHDRVILIQDSLPMLHDAACVNMLKAALMPGRAPINWARVGQRDHCEFVGRIIIVENGELDPGLVTRCLSLDIKV